MKVGLVSCSSTKDNKSTYAKDLYISSLFKYSLRYCLKNYDVTYILSAKYGLLKLTDIISPYNYTLKSLSSLEVKLWSYRVFKDIEKLHDINNDVFYFHCGKEYRRYLKNKLIHEAPLQNLRIGKQLKFYKDNEN